MPEDYQRVMLFEKLEYYLNIRLKRYNVGKTDEELAQLETAKFRLLIKKIRDLYAQYNPLYKEQSEKYLRSDFEEGKE